MLPLLKKYSRFLFYSCINAFITASGMSLLLTAGFFLTAPTTERTWLFDISSVTKINVKLLILLFFAFLIAFFVLFFLTDKLYRQTIPFSLMFFSLCILSRSPFEMTYLTIVLAIIAAALVYVFKETFPDKDYRLFKGKNLYIFVGILTVLMTAMVSLGCICRMYDFNTSTYDFGIFAQMFESMATDFTQTTTLERGAPMQHFAVHFSPIYYLLLPFYMIFRRPEFLLAAQAAVCFSGIIPLLLLCKHYRYKNTASFLISLVFLCYPAFTCACFYDFHENVFLLPLILWLLYFAEKRSMLGAAVIGLLLLCVKEDAGVYLVLIGLYALFNKKCSKLMGTVLAVMGIAGFIGITAFINAYGEGIMVGRYQIFLVPGEDSLVNVVLNVLKNPAFFLSELLSEEKLVLIIQLFFPLMFIPLKTRRLSDWVLIVPLVLFNLATDYGYQCSIHYQYVFSTGAFLVFLFVKNFRYEKAKNKTAAAAVLVSAILLLGYATPKYYNIMNAYEGSKEYDAARAAIAEVPRDAKIFASTYLTPYLYDCPNVYMYPAIYNTDISEPDFVLLDKRYGALAEYDDLLDMYQNMGYGIYSNESFVTVLVAPWHNEVG